MKIWIKQFLPFNEKKLVDLFVLEHQVEAREVRARMELPMVRAVLETGVSRNSVMQVIERRLRETGRGSLLEQQLIKRERERDWLLEHYLLKFLCQVHFLSTVFGKNDLIVADVHLL